MEKVMMCEIDSLDNSNGCFASNNYFAKFFGITPGRVSQIIKGLEDKNLIKIDYEHNGKQVIKRTVRVVNKLNRGYLENYRGYLENAQDNNTISNTNIHLLLSKNEILIDQLKVKYGNRVDVLAKAKEFETFCQSTKHKHKNESDLCRHFTFWLPSNLTVYKNMDAELDYFINLFNEVAKTDYKPEEEMKPLLQKWVEQKVSKEDLIKAIRNMRSSNDKNEWQKKTNYQNATPTHLLKYFNKYLNIKY
jgi:hypothetical protein